MNFSWLAPLSRPLVVAHRGSSGKAPENTLAAFRLARDEGADAIELDVHLSGDGDAVVIHDGNLARTTGGKGPVRNHTLEQLKRLNAASGWEGKYTFEPIPALDEVLREFGQVLGINIEIKGEYRTEAQRELVRRCVECVRRHKLSGSVMISSFRVRALKEVGFLDPGIIRGLLYDPLYRPVRMPSAFAKSLGIQYLIMNRKRLLKRTVSAVHRAGIMAGEYAVNSTFQAGRSLRYGTDAVYTDFPSEIIRFFDRIK